MDMSFEQMVRERAYQIWMAAGQADGTAHENWVSAEQAVKSEMPAAKAAPRKVVKAAAKPTVKKAAKVATTTSAKSSAKAIAAKTMAAKGAKAATAKSSAATH